ncbi:MAG: methyltransferase domain-containing protein [Anaerolineales bacterium]|nr:methyltransferase domain-containing protein [Anaerolineales bacterium]
MDDEYYSYIKEWFRKESRFYHFLVDIPSSRFRDKVVDFSDVRTGSRILDVATGTGGLAFAFAKKGYDVVGVDLSEDMIEVAKRLNEYKNLRFEVADATDLPFEDSYFDISSISLALHDMPLTIREKAVEEMVRVTKPEGNIVIVDYSLPKNKVGSFLVYHLMKAHETKYFPEFVKSDFEALLIKSGIEIKDERHILLGAGILLKGKTYASAEQIVEKALPAPNSGGSRRDSPQGLS